MRTSVVAPREVFDTLLTPKGKRLSVSKPRSSPPLLLPLLLCVPLLLTLGALSAEIMLVNQDFTTVSHVQHLINAAEDASPVLENFNESLIKSATYYPEDLFKVDWSRYVKTSDILHQNALHRGCMTYKDSIIPSTFGRGQSERDEVVNRSDPKLLDEIRKCPDVDILLPTPLRNFGYCEDGAAYTKFLGARMLPRWVLDVKFEDPVHKRSVSYHDLCPNTPMLFFNHYWEGIPDSSDWPAAKPLYLMPNIEMYELDESYYWRADVILCKTALCARYLRKWFLQEGNPRGTRVVYTRHTTTNLAVNQLHPSKNFSDVSFLHTAGTSIQKGTRQVLDCWLDRPEFPRLDFYMDKTLYESAFSDYEQRISDSTNVYLHTGGLSVSDFSQVLTQGRYFLCPSVMEGYGHYINQARSARAFIFTTDVAPMNELITPTSGALIRARTGAYGEQFLGGVSPKEHALQNVPGLVAGFENGAVCDTVRDFLENSTPEERASHADKALQQYYFDTVFFAHKMNVLRTFARAKSHPSLRGKILKTSSMHYFFTDGCRPTNMDVMMRLKGAGFSAIANAFREREKRLGGGLPLLDFVEIVLPGLPRAKTVEEKSASVSALIDLFEDIDINGDGVMEFDEFTSFCVDAGMVATRSQTATLKHRYERDFTHSLKTTAVTLEPNVNSRSSATSSSTLNPVSIGIEKLKWSDGFRMFLVVENPARSVKIFTSEGKLVAEVNVANEKHTQSEGLTLGSGESSTGIPMNDVLLVGDGVAFVTPTTTAAPSASSISALDAVFIVKFQWLGVSTTDFAISFYDMNESKKVAGSSGSKEFGLLKNLGLTTTTAQLTLRFCESSALLLGSGNDFMVNIWKIINAETKILWRRLAGHTDLVLDALEIPSHDLLVSCDLRQNIRLWDITDGRARGSLVAHERGVRQLCYSQQHDLLLSAGFEFEAFAWDLSSRQVALTLSGHRAPLLGVQLALFQTERAITGDCQGIFKVWDITRSNASSSGSGSSHAVQLESIDLGMPSARVEALSFICMHPSSRNLWVVTSGSCTLQHLRSVRVQQFDEVPLRAFYHYSANKFVVVAGSVCSLWDGETGSCSEEFTHVGNIKAPGVNPKGDSDPPSKSTHNEPGTELLACSHDAKCRKLVVVTEQGAVGVFNCQNFVQMRHCQETFMSKSRPLRRKSAVNNPQPTNAPTCAVAGVHYCSDNKLIILTDAGTSSIVVIDDNSDQETSKGAGVLRRLINIPGGIFTSAYSFHASMVATVAADPEGMKISLWDFETLALLGHCKYSQDGFSTINKDGSTLSIQTLQFWDEFPILIAADSIGGVYFFAVTPLLHAFTGKLLHAFPNDHGIQSKRRSRKKSSTIPENTSENEADDEEGCSNANDSMMEAAEIAARKMLLSKSLRKNALTSIPDIKSTDYPVKSPLDTSSAVTCLKVVYDEASDRYLLFIGDERGYVGIWDPAMMIRRLSLAKIPEIKSKYLRRGYQPKTMFYRDYLKETTDVDGRKTQRDKHRQAVSHGASGDWRGAMLLGEDFEHMNIRASHMDLKRLSRRRQDSKAPRSKIPTQQTKNPSSAHVKESAVVNAVAAAEFLMTKKSTLSMPKNRSVRGFSVQSTPETSQWPGSHCHENFPQDISLVRRWQAHMDALTSLEISRHPNVVVTCGMDMRVFVWDWEGSCLGKLFDPENPGPYPWKFRRDNIIRTKDRDVLVQDLLRELERTPVEKLELRRQTLYAEHVGRRNVNELRNVNAMLLEHIISNNPEIKMLEQDIQIKSGLEVASPTTKNSKFRESRKTGTLRALALLPPKTEALDPIETSPSQSLCLQSLSQVNPLLHAESTRKASVPNDSPSFLESGDLKMDKTYLENELSITCPSSTPVRKEKNIQHQIQVEYDTAQQVIATRVTLTRKAKEMYSNMEQVRNRVKTRRPPSPDGIDQVGDPLEASAFLKRHFPPSALAIRPQTAPIRALTTSTSGDNIRWQKKSPASAQRLQASASEPALPPPANPSPPRKPSSGGFNPGRRSSLDQLYMEEFHRYRQQHKERENPTVPEDFPAENPQFLRPLHKLQEINDIIDKAQGYCDDNLIGDQPRPVTAPIAARRSVSHCEDLCISFTSNSQTETLRQHLEDTKHRMQEAMRDDKRVPHRQNLQRLRLQTQQQQQRRRMQSYLQQKRRELTTNIGNVFKGLQTADEKAQENDVQPKDTHRKSQQRSSITGLLKSKGKTRTTSPKLVSAQKTFGMYSVQEVMSVIRLFWSMDADGSGNISMEELQQFKSVFEKLGYHNMGDIFQTIDANGDGEVSLRELLATCFHYANKQQIDGMLQLAKVGSVRAFLLGTGPTTDTEERNPFVGNLQTDHKRELMAIFRVFDHNGDGGVSMQEIMEALRVDDDDVMATVMAKEHDKAGNGRYEPVVSSGLTREDVELIYREFDRDKDATLDFDEFVAVMANLYAHKPSLHR